MAQSARFAKLMQQPTKIRRAQRKSHKPGHSVGISRQERRGWGYVKRRHTDSQIDGMEGFLDD